MSNRGKLVKKKNSNGGTNCLRASNSSRNQSKRCRKSLWMQFNNRKSRQAIRQVSMTKSWLRSRKTWCGRIRACHRPSRTWRNVIVYFLKKWTRSRFTNGSSSMLFPCSVSSATSFSLPKSSLTTWKLAPRIMQANGAFSLRYHLLYRLSVLAWCRTRLITAHIRTMFSK